MRFFCEAGFIGVEINLRPFASKAISWSVRFVLDIFLMNFSLVVLSLFLYWFLEALRLVDRFWLMVWVRTGLALEESVKHTFEYNATLSFLFSCLEKAFTRVVSFNVISLLLLFVGTSVFRGSEVGSARSLQDSFLCLLTFGLVRNHGC